jgi:hypothetical protein
MADHSADVLVAVIGVPLVSFAVVRIIKRRRSADQVAERRRRSLRDWYEDDGRPL